MAARQQPPFRGADSKSKATDSKAGKETHNGFDMRTTEDDWDRLGDLIYSDLGMFVITISYTPTFDQYVVAKEDDRRSNWKFKKYSKPVDKVIFAFGYEETLSSKDFVRDFGLIKCLASMNERPNPFFFIPALDGFEMPSDFNSGGSGNTKSQGTEERKAKACYTSVVQTELCVSTTFKDTQKRLRAAQRILKLSEEFFSRKKADAAEKFNSKEKPDTTDKSHAKLESKAAEVSDSSNKAKAIDESDSKKKAKAIEDSNAKIESKATEGSEHRKKADAIAKFNSKAKPKTTDKSKVKLESKAAEVSDSSNKAKAIEDSDAKIESKATEGSEPRKKDKVVEISDSRKRVIAREKSRTKHELKATERETISWKDVMMNGSKVGKGANDQAKTSSRPGIKSVRTCMNCGLQEPAPKAFKKCRRCKDEGCRDPPYYCGRDCQVLDWSARHRQQHEKNAEALSSS